jgi:hypothetical protein
MTPAWSLTCAHETRLFIDAAYDAQRYAVTPTTIHEDNASTTAVSKGGTWQDGVYVPTMFYVQDACVTITADSANGPVLAESCFGRAPLQAGGEPPACGVARLSAMPPSWAAGCGGVGGTITVTGSVSYISADGAAVTDPVDEAVTLEPGETCARLQPRDDHLHPRREHADGRRRVGRH